MDKSKDRSDMAEEYIVMLDNRVTSAKWQVLWGFLV